MDKDENTSIIPLPLNTTIKEAREKVQTLHDMALGLVTTQRGYAIRVHKDEEVYNAAKARLEPGLAEVVGQQLMQAKKDDGYMYIIRNLPKRVRLKETAQMLNEYGWQTRPERFTPNADQRKHDVIVFSYDQPPEANFELCDGQIITIEEYQENLDQRRQMSQKDMIVFGNIIYTKLYLKIGSIIGIQLNM